MIVVNSSEIRKFTDKKTSVALGSFDALHRGHTQLIKMAADIAKERGYTSLVQLFRIPPGGYNSKGEIECVNTLEKRLSILEAMGIDMVVIEDFDESFRKTSYKEFVSEYIQEKYNAAVVCAGYNYRFGFKAEGNTEILAQECKELGVDVYIQECVRLDRVISSSLIREMVRCGDMEKAALYMGRNFSLCGEVIKGRQLGREMGIPTANIELPQGIVAPADGVYKTCVMVDGVQYMGVTNVGGKPTVNVKERNCETHIIGFDGDLYGRQLEIEFCDRLRDIQNFESIGELKIQLEKDLKKVMKKIMKKM